MADETYDVEVFAAQLGNALQFLKTPGGQPVATPNITGSNLAAPNASGDVISNVAATGQAAAASNDLSGLPATANIGGSAAGAHGQNQDGFYVALLNKLGMPVTGANMQFMRAWNRAEGMDSSHYNPFATTQAASGASNVNRVGVKSYTSFDQGVNATAQTLQNGRYGSILDALRNGNDSMAAARAVAATPWGTGTLIQKVLGGSNAPSNTVPNTGQPQPAINLTGFTGPARPSPAKKPAKKVVKKRPAKRTQRRG